MSNQVQLTQTINQMNHRHFYDRHGAEVVSRSSRWSRPYACHCKIQDATTRFQSNMCCSRTAQRIESLDAALRRMQLCFGALLRHSPVRGLIPFSYRIGFGVPTQSHYIVPHGNLGMRRKAPLARRCAVRSLAATSILGLSGTRPRRDFRFFIRRELPRRVTAEEGKSATTSRKTETNPGGRQPAPLADQTQLIAASGIHCKIGPENKRQNIQQQSNPAQTPHAPNTNSRGATHSS